MDDALRRLTLEVGEFRRLVSDRLGTDRTREKAFDALYEELKQYKEDFLFKAERPLLLDLLLFYDSLLWFQESMVKQEMSTDVLADSFQYLIDELLEVLYRRDVLPVEAPGKLDLRIHKVVRVEDTDAADNDQLIAQIAKRGFQRGETLLRPEEVIVYRARRGRSGP